MKSTMTRLLKLLFLLLITHYGIRFVLDLVVDHFCARIIPAVHAAPLDNPDPAIYTSHIPVITGGFATTASNAATATSATFDTAQTKSNEPQLDHRHQISDDCAAYCRKGCEGSTNGICYDWRINGVFDGKGTKTIENRAFGNMNTWKTGSIAYLYSGDTLKQRA
ncbi:hypothetical protein NpPPO83_00004317 [Neofusicoccum parvum]|uniref:Uncharacterized protein n=1 Tax=Neofusicoccum parvum TaxID=310453 RepID=A0ACB5S8Q7_9PEZI|nr:hypothetical protein NpPPO83_00004317 [Neofusicoccum parvum]